MSVNGVIPSKRAPRGDVTFRPKEVADAHVCIIEGAVPGAGGDLWPVNCSTASVDASFIADEGLDAATAAVPSAAKAAAAEVADTAEIKVATWAMERQAVPAPALGDEACAPAGQAMPPQALPPLMPLTKTATG